MYVQFIPTFLKGMNFCSLTRLQSTPNWCAGQDLHSFSRRSLRCRSSPITKAWSAIERRGGSISNMRCASSDSA